LDNQVADGGDRVKSSSKCTANLFLTHGKRILKIELGFTSDSSGFRVRFSRDQRRNQHGFNTNRVWYHC